MLTAGRCSLSELHRPREYATVPAAEPESATDSIRQIESRQDEVLRELDLPRAAARGPFSLVPGRLAGGEKSRLGRPTYSTNLERAGTESGWFPGFYSASLPSGRARETSKRLRSRVSVLGCTPNSLAARPLCPRVTRSA